MFARNKLDKIEKLTSTAGNLAREQTQLRPRGNTYVYAKSGDAVVRIESDNSNRRGTLAVGLLAGALVGAVVRGLK